MLITNYITSAWRNILRHKLFSIINIMGLAIGLAAVMLIALYVRYETSYDSFWKNADNIYRLHIQFTPPGQDPAYRVTSPPPVIVAMKDYFPEIDEFARMGGGNRLVTHGDETFQEPVSFVDPSITKIFDFEVIQGDLEASLIDKSGLVLNQSVAQKYFGDENPMGKILTIEGPDFKRDFTVSAIIKDLPENSHFFAQTMVRINAEDWGDPSAVDNWFSASFHSFFTLNEGSSIENLSDMLPDFVDTQYPQIPLPDLNVSDMVQLSVMALEDLHLYAGGIGEYRAGGDIDTVITFSVVASLILIIASVNFMNLSTARASQRTMEVSLRKVHGADRKNLIIQFIGESIVLTLIGFLVAMTITEISLPHYSDILSIPLGIDYFSSDLVIFLAIAFLVGAIGGIYPAFILSGLRPARILKSNNSKESGHTSVIRSFLVTLQFTISIVLFVATAAIYGQMYHIENMDLGYNKNDIVTISSNSSEQLGPKIDVLKRRLEAITGVEAVTWTWNFQPGSRNEITTSFRSEEISTTERPAITERHLGYDFFKTYEIPMISGRAFDIGRSDEPPLIEEIFAGNNYAASVILNEAAARSLGYNDPTTSVGKSVFMSAGRDPSNPDKTIEVQLSIIGIIGDVHFRDLKNTTSPEAYLLNTRTPSFVTMRIGRNPVETMEAAKVIWQEELPSVPFNYQFASDALADFYAAEKDQMTMFAAFSGLAIFIACLGLFGLASFTAERRTKEIGIRKVFGAEVWQIVRMLVFQFSKPVLIANIIAWPVAYLAMSRWLESFVYRIDDMAIIALCLVAGLSALLIAWATVAGNSYAVARQNPIKALRYE